VPSPVFIKQAMLFIIDFFYNSILFSCFQHFCKNDRKNAGVDSHLLAVGPHLFSETPKPDKRRSVRRASLSADSSAFIPFILTRSIELFENRSSDLLWSAEVSYAAAANSHRAACTELPVIRTEHVCANQKRC
jgi:hypothetical protein